MLEAMRNKRQPRRISPTISGGRGLLCFLKMGSSMFCICCWLYVCVCACLHGSKQQREVIAISPVPY